MTFDEALSLAKRYYASREACSICYSKTEFISVIGNRVSRYRCRKCFEGMVVKGRKKAEEEDTSFYVFHASQLVEETN